MQSDLCLIPWTCSRATPGSKCWWRHCGRVLFWWRVCVFVSELAVFRENHYSHWNPRENPSWRYSTREYRLAGTKPYCWPHPTRRAISDSWVISYRREIFKIHSKYYWDHVSKFQVKISSFGQKNVKISAIDADILCLSSGVSSRYCCYASRK